MTNPPYPLVIYPKPNTHKKKIYIYIYIYIYPKPNKPPLETQDKPRILHNEVSNTHHSYLKHIQQCGPTRTIGFEKSLRTFPFDPIIDPPKVLKDHKLQTSSTNISNDLETIHSTQLGLLHNPSIQRPKMPLLPL